MNFSLYTPLPEGRSARFSAGDRMHGFSVDPPGAAAGQPGSPEGFTALARVCSKHELPPLGSWQKRSICHPLWLAVIVTSTSTSWPSVQVTWGAPTMPLSLHSPNIWPSDCGSYWNGCPPIDCALDAGFDM